MQEYKIAPVPIQREIDKITLSNVHVKLFKEAYVYVDMFSRGSVVQQTAVVLTPDEYKAWADDDNYILELVMSKLGFKILAEPTPAPAPATTSVETIAEEDPMVQSS